ncbi:MAG: polysaccharide biosynthesis protein PslG [Thermoleophilaceae bacterium]|jgi:hypothetical protein|nr:polysaccharide biosynthesis protein PslG [Thermoleophilaceae bacterium]
MNQAIRTSALSLAALIAVLALAGPAEAKGLVFGVHAQNSLNAVEEQRMGQGNVGAIRQIFRWSQVEPDPDEPYNWGLLDYLMRQAGRNGVDVLPVIVGTPSWASDNPSATAAQGSQAWPTNAVGAERLRLFIAAIVERYGRGGTFWAASPDVPYRPIKEYQVWNEPNRPLFSPGGNPNAALYASLLAQANVSIKSRDPHAKVLMAGMPERTTTSKPLDKYLKQFYEVPGVEKIFDIMTLHPYGVDERGVEGAILRMRSLLKKVHDNKRPLWVTEVGWGSGGEASPFTKSAKDQGKLLTSTAKLLEKKRKKFKLGAVFWFSWRDRLDPGNAGVWQDHTGLFKRDGGPKPAWDAFTKVTGGKPGTGDLQPPLGIPLLQQSHVSVLDDLLASKPQR